MAKGKLFALLAVFVALGVVTATGAFTTVSADRTANINVSGDSSALLQIDGATNGPVPSAVNQADGVASIDLESTFGNGASGINPDATTALSPIVNVTNNGQEDVGVTFSVSSVTGSGLSDSNVRILNASGGDITGDTKTLSSGSRTQFGLELDLVGVDQNDVTDFDVTIDIEANSDDA